jgi:hypothetical protein
VVRLSINTVTQEPDAFAKKALDLGLSVHGPSQGYLYARDRAGVIYKTPPHERYFYMAQRVAQQTNAAAGMIVIDLGVPTGQLYRLESARMLNSGNNTAVCTIVNEDLGTMKTLAEIGAAAGTKWSLPSIGSAASASGNISSSIDCYITKGQYFRAYNSNAGVQNDTVTLSVCFEVLNSNATMTPTWSVAASTNPSDVTLADSTISDANTHVTSVVQR